MYKNILKTIFIKIIIFFSLFHLGMSAPSYLLVDYHTGKELVSHNADQVRFPASLTKMMTLYILFEQIKEGRISLDDEIIVSKNAANKPPIKMYLQPGTTIPVRLAIQAIGMKSANDISVAVAERISGTESGFAHLMNERVRALGMTQTVFYNASGLPNRYQVTTARDMAILGAALMRDHPEFKSYFEEAYFFYNGRRFKNSNTLLGRIPCVNGIKTGYTPQAGNNLVTSCKIDNHTHTIGVVMGEAGIQRRDAMMIQLLNQQVPSTEQIFAAERRIRQRTVAMGPVLKWAIQTGSFRSHQQAQEFIRQFKAQNKQFLKKQNILDKLIHVIPKKVKKRRQRLYATHVGRFDDKKRAQQLCQEMRKKSLSCYVVKAI